MAERTTLHFADVRLRRRAEDLGTGWGHNSQWRTDARLDYEDEERFWFNLDGPIDISGDTPVLRGPIKYSGDLSRTVEERRLVLAYRCLVQGKLSPDPFPYIDSLTTLKSDKFWLRSWSEPR
jgi:hypothetical protein